MKSFSCFWDSVIAVFACATVVAGAPANDAFANRISLNGSSVDFSANPFGSTIEANDPATGPNAYVGWVKQRNLGTQWWTWTSPVTGYALISVVAQDQPNYDSALEIFPGDSLQSLTLADWVVDL